ncbi:MAG: zinc ribbon domain-containing protein [Actinomycetota bacterium]|jgi:uncharacterized OB-fold protein|nr:zinc ribbon domain-containing protein [Actinomycetota bacterium]
MPEPTEPTAAARRFENAYFADGLAQHRLVVKRCTACEHAQFPALPRCPACGSWELRDDEIRTSGDVYSWIRINREELVTDDAADLLPLVVVTVDLDDGVRLFGRYAPGGTPAIGERVAGTFVERRGATDLVFERAAR